MSLYQKLLVVLFLLVAFSFSSAAGLFCSSSSSGYCNYSGKIGKVYVNRSNILLIYTNGAMDLTQLSNAGEKFSGVTRSTAIAVDMNKYPEFGKNMLSTALSAFIADRSVTLQCKDTHGAYLQTDRIWVGK